MTAPTTLFDKIWSSHAILVRPDGATLLHVDRHLVHDGSGNAFRMLKEKGLAVRRPGRTFATPDHYVSTLSHDLASINEPHRRGVVEDLEANAKAEGLTLFGLRDRRQGIVHVIGPEQGLSQPGMIMVCGDSHTATHGALGALAFGVGASEVGHVLATQTLWQSKPKNMRIVVDGALAPGVHAEDVILAIIARIGTAGGAGHVIEYAGSTIQALGIEGRLTTCNMSIEAGARAGMVAPDDTTFEYLHGRPYAPKGADWDQAVAYWGSLRSDDDAQFDSEVGLDAALIAPMVTWGTSPEAAAPITERVPDPASAPDAARRDSMERALAYMDLRPGMPLSDIANDRVFIGSCTNSRIEDLRAAAKVLDGRRAVIPAMAVPGSGLVKAQAEAEGLDAIFKRAGFDWREAGCSMCVGMNGDLVAPGERCASTSNRNFVGRQGKGARTHLVSPAMAAAAAIAGKLTDVRQFLTRPCLLPVLTLRLCRSGCRTSTLTRSFRRVSCGANAMTAGGTSPKPEFVLNWDAYRDARIVVAAHNFGCGSSRETAVWALYDYGIRAVLAPSFGDIFFNNSFQNGLLPVVLPAERVAALRATLEQSPGSHVAIDLEAQTATGPDGAVDRFEIDPFRKQCLLAGTDDISFTLGHRERIAAFENAYEAKVRWL